MAETNNERTLIIDVTEWSWLRSHLERGGLIVVDPCLDIEYAALMVAEDNIATIEHWVSSGKISKPSESQIELWDKNSTKKFSMLIIRPYVLIQEN